MPLNDAKRVWQHIRDLRQKILELKEETIRPWETHAAAPQPALDAEVEWFIAVAEEWARQRTAGGAK
jgi:hypothetical protein